MPLFVFCVLSVQTFAAKMFQHVIGIIVADDLGTPGKSQIVFGILFQTGGHQRGNPFIIQILILIL